MICVIPGFAQILVKQRAILDSLKQQLTENRPDSIKAASTLAISDFYLFNDNDSALLYANRALYYNKQFNNPAIRIRAYTNIFITQGLQRNDVAALKTLFTAQKLVDNYQDPSLKRYFLQAAGLLYNSLEDYRNSLQYFFASTPPIEDTAAQDFYHTVICRIISEDYYKLNMLDSALVYAHIVLKGLEKTRMDNGTVAHRLLGNIYRRKGQLQPALKELHTSLWLAENADYLNVEAIKSQLGLAQTFYALRNIDSSLYFCMAVMHASKINSFVEEKLQTLDLLKDIYAKKNNTDSAYKYTSLTLNLRDSIYNANKTKAVQRAELEQQMRTVALENEKKSYETRSKIYALIAALLVFLLIVFILIRHNRHKQKAYALLQKQKEETDEQKLKVEQSLQELKATQVQLIQKEKMASLGELTAGIAHEIQNPLNFVNNFSEVNKELLIEIKEELNKGDLAEVKLIVDDVICNEEKINHHGKRADAIVKGMLEHSRTSKGEKQPTNINALAEEYLRLAYHGLRAKDKSFNADFKTDFDESIGKINIVPQDIGRVLLNLFNNAFYTVSEKKSKLNGTYEPMVTITTKKENGSVIIKVTDNGNGIPQNIVTKIFQPFFTTKPTGQGTGLGLSLSYDIIKAHGGEIKLESKEGEGSKFTIELQKDKTLDT
ncbi:GHKL domain-containing protein [Ilyomonas limi]|uniref:histidine kinase n=2 Tax=Ilyomonas limi TaxID=2575867 RepID=A0A4U3KUI6_9BACT|nr:GHKL domain-containing protein [Ilyomonas limi]